MNSQDIRLTTRKSFVPFVLLAGVSLVLLVAGCAGKVTKARSVSATEAASRSSAPAWHAGTTPPKPTVTLIAQAGHGLSPANTNLGTVDEVLGSMVADVQVNPSTKRLNDQYARIGRCIGEQLTIHDLGHELALIVAYNRRAPAADEAAQAAVEKASTVCAGDTITPDASYRQSLATNP
jgi:hypothetical protein